MIKRISLDDFVGKINNLAGNEEIFFCCAIDDKGNGTGWYMAKRIGGKCSDEILIRYCTVFDDSALCARLVDKNDIISYFSAHDIPWNDGNVFIEDDEDEEDKKIYKVSYTTKITYSTTVKAKNLEDANLIAEERWCNFDDNEWSISDEMLAHTDAEIIN